MSIVSGAFARRIAGLRPASHFRSIEERLGIVAFAFMLSFVMVHSLWAHEFTAGSIEIDHPWSRATPEGAKVAAGYMVIRNKGGEPDRLVGVSADISERAEIHEMSVDANGVMTMRPVEGGVEVPAGGTAELKPGSFHIMFLDLKRGAKAGEKFAGTLTFEKAGAVPVEFAVDAMSGGSSGAHGNHGNHGG